MGLFQGVIMKDKEINMKLAEAMGKNMPYEHEGVIMITTYHHPLTGVTKCARFSYKDPDIFTECVLWLAKNAQSLLWSETSGYYIYDFVDMETVIFDSDPLRVVALAYIQSKEAS